MPRAQTQIEKKEEVKQSPKLQALLGELLKGIPLPNGDPQFSLNRNRLLQQRLIEAMQATAELQFPGINDMIGLLAAKEAELLQVVRPQC